MDAEIVEKIKQVILDIQDAKLEVIEVSTWDVTLLFLYSILLIGTAIGWFDCEIVNVKKEVDELEIKMAKIY